MEEDGGLRHIGAFQLLLRAPEHDVGDAEFQHLVGLLKKFSRLQIVVVQLFAHSYELCSLTGKNVCSHKYYMVSLI